MTVGTAGKKCISLILILSLCIAFSTAVFADAPPVYDEAGRSGVMEKAVSEYEAEDHSPLEKPAAYRILWLGYTHVTYEELDFRMTEFDREYLSSVAQNFESVVEGYADHCVDIQIDLFFVDEETPLTKVDDDDWLYLAEDTVRSSIDSYCELQHYDTVLTTVQTDGDENYRRNADKPGYGVNYVMLGLETSGIGSGRGYSTFDLCEPNPGTYPLEDPAIPSLFATAVAVHEWMHQLEDLGRILGIEYPSTHAYVGPSEFPGYQAYTADKNNYDFFEFYELVLRGELPYTDANGQIKHVGMYPSMWKLIQYDPSTSGIYTIQAPDGHYLAGQEDEPRLTILDGECRWMITALSEGRYVLSPVDLPDWRMDLSNAWDEEGNTVSLWYDTGYLDAQTWYLIENEDGSYGIETPSGSGRIVTVDGVGDPAVLRSPGLSSGASEWIFTKVSGG